MKKMNLQFFAEPTVGGDPGTGSVSAGAAPQTPPPTGQQAAASQVDYGKIQQMLEGTLLAKEETALKAYFKQQGLSEDEMKQAIAAYKQQKAASQPDVNALQTQMSQAQMMAQQKEVENAAILAAVGIGLDAKTIPYVLKMADLSTAMGQDGKVNEEALKTALNKVLEDIPALKPQSQQSSGFQIGASGGNQTTNNDDALKKAFGL